MSAKEIYYVGRDKQLQQKYHCVLRTNMAILTYSHLLLSRPHQLFPQKPNL